jgi:hypothetical protein
MYSIPTTQYWMRGQPTHNRTHKSSHDASEYVRTRLNSDVQETLAAEAFLFMHENMRTRANDFAQTPSPPSCFALTRFAGLARSLTRSRMPLRRFCLNYPNMCNLPISDTPVT